ncbi:hypothetical protein ARMSODRAFT_969082 [Armillaria solidipes]|uniref:Uncharacterized protein n=1 Tax=Armillaria solidipes TaxID=1076256 RepID=A0A2H3C386_9AGAR|nr:hypothetical protein ARMSODRAFT_969082 [Armillaria solidipes]
MAYLDSQSMYGCYLLPIPENRAQLRDRTNGFVLLDGDYFDDDSDHRELLKTEHEPPQNYNMDDNVTVDVSNEHKTSSVTLALPSEQDAESQYSGTYQRALFLFSRELETLKRLEGDYNERVKAKTRAAIDGARQRDEELHVRLQSKMQKRVSLSLPTETEDLPVAAGLAADNGIVDLGSRAEALKLDWFGQGQKFVHPTVGFAWQRLKPKHRQLGPSTWQNRPRPAQQWLSRRESVKVRQRCSS